MLKDPKSSCFAGMFNFCSFFFTFVSVSQFCIETLPEVSSNEWCQTIGWYIDNVVNVFFIIEILMRFYLSSSARGFFTDMSNFIDVLSVLPFFIELLINIFDHQSGDGEFRLLKLCRMLRIFRIAKVTIVDLFN